MALSVVQHKLANSAANSTTLDITVTSTGAGNLLVCGASNQGTRTVTGISGGGTWVQFPSAEITVSGRETDIWYVVSSSSGVTTVTITYSGAAGTFSKTGEVWEVSGFTTAAEDGANTTSGNTAGGTMTGAAVVTTSTNGFVVGINGNAATGTIDQNPAAGNEFTSGGDSVDRFGAVSLISSTAVSHTPAWHVTADVAFVASTAAFKEGGPPPTPAGLPQIGVSVWG